MSQDMPSARDDRNLLPSTYFQTPTLITDELMVHLTDPELRCLLYTVRRITGFLKSQDKISLSQLTDGITTKAGKRLDHGAGVSYKVASAAMQNLCAFGILKVSKAYDPSTSTPNEYEINWGEGLIRWDQLEARTAKKSGKTENRNDKLRALAAAQKGKKVTEKSHVAVTSSVTVTPPPLASTDPLPPSQVPTPSPLANYPPLPPSQLPYNKKDNNNNSSKEECDTSVSPISSSPSSEKKKKTAKAKTEKQPAPTDDVEELRKQVEKELAAKAKAITAAYARVVAEGMPALGIGGYKIDWGRESRAAKSLAKDWTPEQVTKFYQHLKSDSFWREKHLALVSLEKQIGAYYAGNKNGNHADNSQSKHEVFGVASRTERPDYAYRPSQGRDVSGL